MTESGQVGEAAEEEEEPGSYEEYMLRFMTWEWRDVVISYRLSGKGRSRRKARNTGGSGFGGDC